METDLDDFRNHEIKHRMKAIGLFVLFARKGLLEIGDHQMKVAIEGGPRFTTRFNMLVNPTAEIGVVFSRSFLEFCGLGLEKESKLVNLKKRQRDDVGIEFYTGRNGPLRMVEPQQALDCFRGDPADALLSLRSVFYHGNKGVAHLASREIGPSLGQKELVVKGCEMVLIIMKKYFYGPLGRRPPGADKI